MESSQADKLVLAESLLAARDKILYLQALCAQAADALARAAKPEDSQLIALLSSGERVK